MIAGLVALFAGILGLALHPETLSTYHYNQHVIALTHLFVLGWITTIVMGALYQLVPVALETKLFSDRLARWQFWLHAVGAGGMVWMFWIWNPEQVGHFGSVLAAGVGLFVYNLARTLHRAPRRNVITLAVTSALVWLTLAVTAGLTLAAGKCSFDSPSGSRSFSSVTGIFKALGAVPSHFDAISAMHAHAHLGALGVFLMLIVGISYKLVPMFTLSEIQKPRRAVASVILLNAGLLTTFAAVLTRSRFKPASALVIIAGLALYGLELRAILRARRRRALDWGLKYFVTAVALLAPVSLIALLLAIPTLPLTVFTGQLENLYGFLTLVGVISLAIIGMLYKIIPFLVWYSSYSRHIGFNKVPALADLYSPAVQAAGYWFYVAGLGVASAGILIGNAPIVRWGCVLLAFSLLTLAGNVCLMLWHLFRPRIHPLPSAAAATRL